MKTCVVGYDAAVSKWVAERIPHVGPIGFGLCKTIGVMDGDKFVAGMVYHNYDPLSQIIEMSGAADTKTWLTKPVLNRMFDYPFLEIGCQMVVMRIREDNIPLKRMLSAYGFQVRTIPRLFGREVDGCVCTLTDDDWATNKFNAKWASEIAKAA